MAQKTRIPSGHLSMLKVICKHTPHTLKLAPFLKRSPDGVRASVRYLKKKGLIFITGEKSIWERLFPTEEGKQLIEGQCNES